MRLRISTKKLLYVLLAFFMILVSLYLYFHFRPVDTIYYKGRKFVFRDNIKMARGVPVYPDEKSLHELFWDPNITGITIIFKPLEKEMGYYAVESFELTYKLSLMYMMNGMNKKFSSLPVNSYENVTSSEGTLKIILVHPRLTNVTLVERRGNIVYIHGKNPRDFDLATIKTVLVAMGI